MADAAGATTAPRRQQGLSSVGSGTVEGHHWTQPCSSVGRVLVMTTHHPAHFSVGLGYVALQEMLLLFKPFSFSALGMRPVAPS